MHARNKNEQRMNPQVAPPADAAHPQAAPSGWVRRFLPLIPRPAGKKACVLDLACGGGRHTRLLLELGYTVVAIDRDVSALADLETNVEVIEADLEDGRPWPLGERRFQGVVVTSYLYRPLLPAILAAVDEGGVLIYETFARGNERLHRPRNRDFLLRSGELLDLVKGSFQVVAFEQGKVETPRPAVIQRLCAVKDLAGGGREPPPHPLAPPAID